MRPSLFCDASQRRLLVIYRLFDAICRSHLQGFLDCLTLNEETR